jgi:hypothetical protein
MTLPKQASCRSDIYSSYVSMGCFWTASAKIIATA